MFESPTDRLREVMPDDAVERIVAGLPDWQAHFMADFAEMVVAGTAPMDVGSRLFGGPLDVRIRRAPLAGVRGAATVVGGEIVLVIDDQLSDVEAAAALMDLLSDPSIGVA